MKHPSTLAVAALLALAAGCAGPSADAARSTGSVATCHVCRYNNDLACLCVNVKNNTPRTNHQGQTYYFCSEDCCAAFQKRPARYVPKSRE